MSKYDRWTVSKIPASADAVSHLCYGKVDKAHKIAGTIIERGTDDYLPLERRWWIYQLGLKGVPEEDAVAQWENHCIKREIEARREIAKQSTEPEAGFWERYAQTAERFAKGRKLSANDPRAVAVLIAYRGAACTDGSEDMELYRAKLRFGDPVITPTFAEFWRHWEGLCMQQRRGDADMLMSMDERSVRRIAKECGLEFAPGKRGRSAKQAG